MFKNYITTTLRKLSRERSYTAINVLGLALGITCSLMLFLLIKYELSFDTFHAKADRICRVNTIYVRAEGEVHDTGTPLPFGPALRKDFPELEKVAMVDYESDGLITIVDGDKAPVRYQGKSGVVFIEPDFFDMFDFPWITGHPKTLAEPNNVALTEELAQKYFPNENPVGKRLRLDNKLDLNVTGVLKNFPANTDFPFKLLVSFLTVKELGYDLGSWQNTKSDLQTYALLPENLAFKNFESRLPAFREKYWTPKDRVNKIVHTVQPLREIHFDTRYGTFSGKVTSKATILAFALIGFFLIVTACINFVNLATAQAIDRAKEVGVRKVLGANRLQLIRHFMGETFVITVFAVFLAVALNELLQQRFAEIMKLRISFDLFGDLAVLGFLLVIIVIVSLLSGFYPALVLSGFQPALALKSKNTTKQGSGLSLRRGLVIVQFAISQALVIGTLIIAAQMGYFHNKDLGFNKDAIVTVALPNRDQLKLESLRTQLLQKAGVKNVSLAYTSASSGRNWSTSYHHKLGDHLEEHVASLRFADARYFETYDLQLLAGRAYAESDTIKEFVVNEALVRQLGFASPQEAIGEYLTFWDAPAKPIVGVVKNFHLLSLHDEIKPCLMATNASSYHQAGIKINLQNAPAILQHIEKVWNATFPENVFEYKFLVDTIAEFYEGEEKMSQLLRIFAGIAILIGCLGLFGLVSFMAARRTKEIGVRKVLGATAGDVLALFSKEFAVLILVAFLLAAPIAYFAMKDWLENFVYRINVGLEVFLVTLVVTFIIAGLTVGYRALKAALMNPVEALRYE
ncbi:MAG: ABC transporter permease [bacterium]